ncbi:hypothetical protein GCM10010243_39310 [Streptomyces matensis]|nr:hypothetical protein GCM10010267_01390 [Streptomyces griseorubens]GGT56906.1 hypothetical protein GCM10010243_39310 [Streptomyces matensis]
MRDTGLWPPLRSMAERRAPPRPMEFEEEPRRELRQASTPGGRADRGNQPIGRRVDTISKQYQVSGARNRARGSTQDGSDGGGAPWES